MKVAQFFLVSVSSAFLVLGCASRGFNRGALSSQLGVAKPVYDNQKIAEEFAKKPNLPKPFCVAYYFLEPKTARGEMAEWRWSEKDRIPFDEIGQGLKDEGVVTDFFPIARSLVEDEDLKSLRAVAAKHQADALLLISGVADVDRYYNQLGWTYLLILPTLFVPASQVDTLFLANATLWDVRNEFLYLTAEAEAAANEKYRAAFAEDDRVVIARVRTSAMEKLKAEVDKMIHGAKL